MKCYQQVAGLVMMITGALEKHLFHHYTSEISGDLDEVLQSKYGREAKDGKKESQYINKEDDDEKTRQELQQEANVHSES